MAPTVSDDSASVLASVPTIPAGAKDCGVLNQLAGWPTTYWALGPGAFDCLIDAVVTGTPASMVIISAGAHSSGRTALDPAIDLPTRRVVTWIVLGMGRLQQRTDLREDGGAVTTLFCSGLRLDPNAVTGLVLDSQGSPLGTDCTSAEPDGAPAGTAEGAIRVMRPITSVTVGLDGRRLTIFSDAGDLDRTVWCDVTKESMTVEVSETAGVVHLGLVANAQPRVGAPTTQPGPTGPTSERGPAGVTTTPGTMAAGTTTVATATAGPRPAPTCANDFAPLTFSTELRTPLGARAIVDGATGQTLHPSARLQRPVTGVRVRLDGRTLVISSDGKDLDASVWCAITNNEMTVDVLETDETIHVALVATPHPHGSRVATCAKELTFTTELQTPLGSRTIVDEATGQTQRPIPTASLLVPTPLPPGWVLQRELGTRIPLWPGVEPMAAWAQYFGPPGNESAGAVVGMAWGAREPGAGPLSCPPVVGGWPASSPLGPTGWIEIRGTTGSFQAPVNGEQLLLWQEGDACIELLAVRPEGASPTDLSELLGLAETLAPSTRTD